MTSRILGSIGRFFIATGLVILLFAAYQLWGTGLQEAAAQGDLSSDFDELLESVGSPIDTAPSSSTTNAPTTVLPQATTTSVVATTIPAAGGTIPVVETDLAEKLYREGGEAIARIRIPKIGLTKVVVEGVKVEDLRNGPGHYGATVFPGQQGNSGIAGHRTTYGAPFNRIDELEPGDEIRIQTVQGTHTYRVMPVGEAYAPEVLGQLTDFVIPEGEEDLGHIIVKPSATWVLGDFGDDRVTLTACHPKLSAARRIIVAAELVSDAVDAPAVPTTTVLDDQIDLATEDLTGQPLDNSDSDEAGNDDADAVNTSSTGDPAAPANASIDDVSLDEGLNGERSALFPAILWGLAAIAVYQGFKQLARRWRRWPAIALGLVPVVILMSLSFEKIDRFLPAG
jgi:sortase A